MSFRLATNTSLLVATLALAPTACALDVEPSTNAKSIEFFENQIRPLLVTKCLECHGSRKQEGNLRLDSLTSMLEGGDSGPAIVIGKPTESLLIEAVNYQSFEMPPSEKLPDEDIRNLQQWIANNAIWPDQGQPIRRVAEAFTEADRNWWAFQPLTKPDVPTTEHDDWARNSIDQFVLHRLNAHGMHPAPLADNASLVRRIYFGLLGLPPSPEQIDDFRNDDSPEAWEHLIDRLLDDQQYGVHWARYWLDVVRYAESDGWNQDAYRPHIWRYRDYVVQSFNDDKPYPEFVRQQLAGDEMRGDNPENLAATGFLRLGIYEYNQRDARSHWDDVMNEMTDVTSDVFLGLGMSCARCHDHKFDPLLRQDYFRLRAFFEPLIWRDDLHFATPEQQDAHDKQLAIWQEATREIRAEIDALLKPYHDRKWKSTVDKFPLDIQACFRKPVSQRTSWEDQMAYLVSRQFEEEGGGPLANMSKEDKGKHEALKRALSRFDHLKPQPLPNLMAATDFGGSISATVIPDDPHQSPIDPGVPTVLIRHEPRAVTSEDVIAGSSGRRTALANWIGSPQNGLTARVIVNRVWQQHFGHGLVPSANDFGHLGQAPTHPKLLDWLTSTFIENNWSIKRLNKLILMSATWQQSAHHPRVAEFQQKDPRERLLWRAHVRRLTAEQIRDASLMVSGELDLSVGGPSVDGSKPRRSIYVKSFRNTPNSFLHAFDTANGLKSVAQRNTTTTPTQSLMMVNGDRLLWRAEMMADRLLTRATGTPRETLAYAFRLTWGRAPTSDELSRSLQFVGVLTEDQQLANRRDRLVDFCHVLLNSSEFIYVD